MVKWSLYNIHKQFLGDEIQTHEKLFEYLNSVSYLTVMKDVRAIPVKRNDNDTGDLTLEEIEVLRSVMFRKEKIVQSEDPQYKICSGLVRKGYIGCEGNTKILLCFRFAQKNIH